MAFRNFLAQLHLWAGLIAFILLIPIGLTGIALAWPDQFNALFNPPPHASGAAVLAPSAYAASAAAALGPRARIDTVTFPARDGEPVLAATAQRRGPPQPGAAQAVSGAAWLDPATGKVLKTGPVGSPLFGVMHQLHENLLIRGWGRALVGVTGIIMFGLSLTGLYLWWPRMNLAKGFAFRRTVSTLLNVHYMAGVWISIPLAIVSLTGIGLSFPALVGGGGARPPEAAARPPEGARGRPDGAAGPSRPTLNMTLDDAAKAALDSAPGARLRSVSAASGARPWRVQVAEGGKVRTLQVDDKTGAVQSAAPAGPPGGGLMGTVRSLHEGGGSPIWKWLVTLTGLAPTLFGITGLFAWVQSNRRKAAAA